MWRQLGRRTLLNSWAATHELRQTVLQVQLSHHETVTLHSPSIVEPASGHSLFSRKFHLHQNSRPFSSNSSVNYEDPASESPISEANRATGGVDFGALNAVDESAKSEFENEDSIFDDAVDSLDVNEGFGEIFNGAVATEESVDAVATEDEAAGEQKKNDPEKVEILLSVLQSSAPSDGSLDSTFEEIGLVLNEDLILKVLETSSLAGENLISFFRWALIKTEFKVTTPMLDMFVTVICSETRKREAYALWDLLNEIGGKKKAVLSTESLNKLIAEFSRLGKAKAAFDVFSKFEEFGCTLNADTYYFTIEALCRRSFYSWASSVCEKMLNGDNLPGSESCGKIISYLCKGGNVKDAHLVYMFAKDKKIFLPLSAVNFLITSLSRIEKGDKATGKEIDKELDNENVALALGMLDDYPVDNRKYAAKPFSSVVKKLCWIEDVDRAKRLVFQMINSGPPPGNALFNCVINGLAKADDMEEALSVMKLMESRGLKPDVYTYTVIMSGYARGGDMEEAHKMFDEAKKKHSKLSPITYHTLIRGYCKLEQYNKAVNLLGEMKQHGVHPNHDEYNKLIKSLCLKALDWETAEKLREEMKVNGLILNARTTALINAIKELKEEVGPGISAPA